MKTLHEKLIEKWWKSCIYLTFSQQNETDLNGSQEQTVKFIAFKEGLMTGDCTDTSTVSANSFELLQKKIAKSTNKKSTENRTCSYCV